MTRTWFPEAHYMPDMGQYRPMYRWYRENPWRLVPGEARYASAGQAISAAKDWLASRLNCRHAAAPEPANDDPLGVEAWHEQRAATAAQAQEQTLGGIIVKGRQVLVERRKVG